MGQSILEKIQAKLELFRLEKRYTRHRHRRSAFISNAIYVDGEYVYQTPASTGNSSSSDDRVDALHGGRAKPPQAVYTSVRHESPETQNPQALSKERKRLNRFSSMPSFSGAGKDFERKPATYIPERRMSKPY